MLLFSQELIVGEAGANSSSFKDATMDSVSLTGARRGAQITAYSSARGVPTPRVFRDKVGNPFFNIGLAGRGICVSVTKSAQAGICANGRESTKYSDRVTRWDTRNEHEDGAKFSTTAGTASSAAKSD